MRWAVGGLGVLLFTLVFLLTTPSEIARDPTLPVLPAPAPASDVESRSRTIGSLPDGTQFLVTVEPAVPDDWLGSTAVIVTEILGMPATVGRVSFLTERIAGYSFENGRYRVAAGSHLVEVDFEDHILEALGPDAEQVITTSIRGGSEFEFPVLFLDDPFRWGSDRQSPVHMATRFATFDVRRGCDDVAAACSSDGSLQVIWTAHDFASAPPVRQPEVIIYRLTP